MDIIAHTFAPPKRWAWNIRVVIPKRSSGLSEVNHSNGGNLIPEQTLSAQLHFEISDMFVSRQLLLTLSINLYPVESQLINTIMQGKANCKGYASGKVLPGAACRKPSRAHELIPQCVTKMKEAFRGLNRSGNATKR